MREPNEVVWEALRRECASVRQHIGLGATAIGQAYFEGTEFYAQALFALSAGFERAAKLVLTLDAAASNGGEFLDGASLKRYGHRIDRLFKAVEEVADRRDFHEEPMPRGAIHDAIVLILTEFASNLNRYYNLEGLQPTHGRGEDPIAAWYKRVTVPILRAHDTETRRERDEAQIAEISIPAEYMVSVMATTETGEPVRDLPDLMRRGREARAASPWARMYVLQVARLVTYVLGQIGEVARTVADVPFIYEFFTEYQLDDATFRRLKIWPPK